MRDMTGNGLGSNVDLNQRTDTCAFTLQTQSDALCTPGPIQMKVVIHLHSFEKETENTKT